MKKKTSKKKWKIKKNSILRKLVLVAILLFLVLNILRYAAYFKKDNDTGIQVSIQNLVNIELKNELYIDENDVIYLSEEDMIEYFDSDLYYEKNESNMRRYISISQNKVLEITENENHMYINGTREKIKGSVIERDGVFYFPISELDSVYNIEVDYLEDKKRLNIEKLSEEKIVGVTNKELNLKYKMTNISKNIDKLSQGETVTIVEDMNNGWVRVKTTDYAVGYVKKSKLINIENERYALGEIDFSTFNLDNANLLEIDDSTYENFNEIISTYDGREDLVSKIYDEVIQKINQQSVDVGVKIDISNVENEENYYKFLKELKAYINNFGVCLIVIDQEGLNADKLENVANIVG